MRLVATAFLLLAEAFAVPTARLAGTLKTTAPSQVCGFLTEFELRTGTWKQLGPAFGCLSPYKDLGAGNPLANNLAYYVDGNANAATQVKLVLNVNNRATAKTAHSELLKAAEALSIKATGQQLTAPLREAIQQGKRSSAKLGGSAVEVTRDDWPTGRGYDVQITIK